VIVETVSRLLHVLNAADIPYVVLHGYEGLWERRPASDLDIAVSRDGFLARHHFLRQLQREFGWHIVQRLTYEHESEYIVLWRETDDCHASLVLCVDLCVDYRDSGRVVLRSGQLLASRRRRSAYWIPAPAIEFVYLFTKRLLKRAVEPRHTRQLSALAHEAPAEARRCLTALYGPQMASRIIDSAISENWQTLLGEQSTVRQTFYRNTLRHQPRSVLDYWMRDARRRVHRLFNGTGFAVALMGPDGAGKTTVARELMASSSGVFRRSRYYHWRPGLLPPLMRWLGKTQSIEEVVDPHGRPPHNMAISLVSLFYYFADFLLGYSLRVFAFRQRTGLVVFDRYFYDLYVDPTRYRMRVPRELVQQLMTIVPRPDMIVVLDASVEQIGSRKTELESLELERQTRVFHDLVRLLNGAVVLRTDVPPERTTTTIWRLIAERLSARLEGSGEL
jgi:thymidylate kinase